MRLDLTDKGKAPCTGRWFHWIATTKSGLQVSCRTLVSAEADASLATVMMRLDAHLRRDGFDNITIMLG